jgi:hypothetical protein
MFSAESEFAYRETNDHGSVASAKFDDEDAIRCEKRRFLRIAVKSSDVLRSLRFNAEFATDDEPQSRPVLAEFVRRDNHAVGVRRRLAGAVLLLSVLGVPKMATAEQSADPLAGETVVAIWNEAALEGIREGSVPAPIASRALAIVNTAMYDAWAAYDPVAIGTDGTSRLRQPVAARTQANVRRAVSIAAYYALQDVSTVPMADVTLGQTRLALDQGDMAERVGRGVAEAVLASRHRDGSNQLGDLHPGPYSDYTSYRSINTGTHIFDPNRWQPLLVRDDAGNYTQQRYLTPQWGNVRPFAVDPQRMSASFAGPARFGEPNYRRQAEALLALSAHLDDTQKAIAEYWSDGMMTDSPPGHWVRFGIAVSKRDRHDLSTDAKMFFALSNAMLDAAIVCWRTKRLFDSERPISAIQTLFAKQRIYAWAGPGRGPRWIYGTDWRPYQPSDVVTPAFPEFISGHSTFSAAGAEVLRRFTGSDVFGASYTQAAGTSIVEPPLPKKSLTLFWPTFTAAADQAGMSRRYGGIHFEDADLAGRRAGRVIGRLAFERASAFIHGTLKAKNSL